MDPSNALQEARRYTELARLQIDAGNYGSAADLAEKAMELYASLDEWMTCGGFLPNQWKA